MPLRYKEESPMEAIDLTQSLQADRFKLGLTALNGIAGDSLQNRGR